MFSSESLMYTENDIFPTTKEEPVKQPAKVVKPPVTEIKKPEVHTMQAVTAPRKSEFLRLSMFTSSDSTDINNILSNIKEIIETGSVLGRFSKAYIKSVKDQITLIEHAKHLGSAHCNPKAIENRVNCLSYEVGAAFRRGNALLQSRDEEGNRCIGNSQLL